MTRLTKYRMVTPTMDIRVPFASQDDALKEAEARAKYCSLRLYVLKTDGEWLLIFDSEKGGNV